MWSLSRSPRQESKGLGEAGWQATHSLCSREPYLVAPPRLWEERGPATRSGTGATAATRVFSPRGYLAVKPLAVSTGGFDPTGEELVMLSARMV